MKCVDTLEFSCLIVVLMLAAGVYSHQLLQQQLCCTSRAAGDADPRYGSLYVGERGTFLMAETNLKNETKINKKKKVKQTI
jgi:hypothetical protein